MQPAKALDKIAMEALRSKITRIFPAQIRACLEELTDDQLWWRPNDTSNSVGNLVLHLSGSTRHYLCRAIGGLDYQRNRPAEFAERGPIPRDQLVRILDETIAQANAALDSFDTANFSAPTDDTKDYATYFDQILGVTVHIAAHMGQIEYITKLLKEGSLDDLWIRSHRSA
jgi:DinB family protein